VIALLRPRLLPHSALTGAFAASLLAFAISGAVAWQPRLGFDYLAYALLLTALYLMLVRIWADGLLARRLIALVVVVTVASAILYVFESVAGSTTGLISGFACRPAPGTPACGSSPTRSRRCWCSCT
jgi:hypothetical protein